MMTKPTPDKMVGGRTPPFTNISEPLPIGSLTDALFSVLLSHLNLTATDSAERDTMETMLRFCTPIATTFPLQDPASLKVTFGDNISEKTVVNISDESGKVWLYPSDNAYPCSVCRANVGEEPGEKGQGIECDLCGLWFHNGCLKDPLSTELYNCLKESPSNVKLYCPTCVVQVPTLNKAFDYIMNSVGKIEGLMSSIEGAKAALDNSIDTTSASASLSHSSEALTELTESITEASAAIGKLGSAAQTKELQYENALDTVVDQVSRLNNVDINALSSKFNLTVNEIHCKLNEDMLKPSTVESLANKLIEARADRETNLTDSNCSGVCVAAIEAKLGEFTRPSESSDSNGPLENNWVTAVTSRQKNFTGGNMTNSPHASNTNTESLSTHQVKSEQSQCNPRTTVVISNIKSRDLIKHSSVIKHNFNKLFSQMKIKNSFITARGSVFVELTSQSDADKVVADWKSTYFSGTDSDPTSAKLLLDKDAQGLVRSVPLEYTDGQIETAIQQNFPGAQAQRFVSKAKGELYTVLISFVNNEQLECALNNQIVIEHSVFEVSRFTPRKSVIRCFRCLQFGHISKLCKNETACKFCSKNHLAESCPDKTVLKCVNCGGAHSSYDKTCKTFTDKAAQIKNSHD